MAIFDGLIPDKNKKVVEPTGGVFSGLVPVAKTPAEQFSNIQSRKETITQAPAPGFVEGIFNKFAPQPIKDAVSTIKKGLVGSQEPDITGETVQTSGLLVKGRDQGLADFVPFGGFRPKTDLQKFNERNDRLLQEGIAPSRAAEIARFSSGYGMFGKDIIQKEKIKNTQESELTKLALNDSERKILRNIGIFETIDKALSSLDFIGVGSIKNIGKNAIQKIAASTDEVVISKLLQKEIPDLVSGAADEFAKIFKYIDDPVEVQTALSRIDSQIKNGGKVVATPTDNLFTPQNNISIPENLKPLAEEAKDTIKVFSGHSSEKGSRYFTIDQGYAEKYGKNIKQLNIPKSEIFDTRNSKDLETLNRVLPGFEIDSANGLPAHRGDAKIIENALVKANIPHKAIALSESTGSTPEDISYFVSKDLYNKAVGTAKPTAKSRTAYDFLDSKGVSRPADLSEKDLNKFRKLNAKDQSVNADLDKLDTFDPKDPLKNLKGGFEADKEGLREYGISAIAATHGPASVYKIGGKPALAVSWSEDALAGIAVHPDFQNKGLAKAFISKTAEDGPLPVYDPNEKMLKLLNSIGTVSKPDGRGVVIFNLDKPSSPLPSQTTQKGTKAPVSIEGRGGELVGDGKDLAAIETRVEKYVKENKADLESEYRAKYGNVYNVDNMKELIPGHAENRTISEAFHKPAAELVGEMVRSAIDANAGTGNKVVFLGGATAAGKSTALELLNTSDEFVAEVGPMIDGTLSDMNRSSDLIRKALSENQQIEVYYVDNTPDRIIGNAIARAQSGGRTVPIETIFNTLLKSRQNMQRLNGKFGTNPNFTIKVIDNSGDTAQYVDNALAFLKSKSYSADDIARFKKQAYDRITKLYEEQSITQKVYEGFTRRKDAVTETRTGPRQVLGEESDTKRPEIKATEKVTVKDPVAVENINTIKQISAEKSVGPIIDILSGKYKNLAPRTIEAFADRLAKLKDTNSINGLMAVLQKIDESVAKGVTKQYTKQSLPKTATGGITNVDQLKKQLEREKQSLVAAKNNPAGHAKAYGPGKIDEYEENIRTLNDRIKGLESPDGDVLPPSLGDLLSHKERASYIDNLARTIKNPEDAALAKAEYDELWDKLNARAVIEFEQLSIEREILEEVIAQDQAKTLLKFFGKKDPETTSLAEILQSSLGTDKKSAQLDSIVTELGFKDLDEAQEGLDTYIATRTRVREIKDKMRELRPEVQTARLLKDFLDDVPVVENNATVVSIDSLATPSKIRDVYKDISGFEKEALDPPRIFKKFFGSEYPVVKETILNPFDDAKGAMVDTINSLAKELEEGVTKKFAIQRGTLDAQRVRRFGEGKMDRQDLVNEVGEERAKEIVSADSFFKGWYDKLLDEANTVLAKIYPNNPDKLIPKHANYYRHLRDKNGLSESLVAIKNLFDTPAGINPELAGLSEYTKPRMKFLSQAQARAGEATETDAIEGAIDYIASFAYLKHISSEIPKFRYLRRRLADIAPTPGDPKADAPAIEVLRDGQVKVDVANVGKERGINNMLVFLDNFSNKLAGKSHPLDRWIADTIPGGRPVMNGLTMLNNRVKANTILFKAGSAIAQLANIPAGVASAKQYAIPGLRRTLGSVYYDNAPIKESSFVKERTLGSLKEQFKTSWLTAKPLFGIDRLNMNLVDQRISGERISDEIKGAGGWILKAFDTIGTHFIWNSHYEKALAQNIDDPVRYADNQTRDIIAGRGVGEVPLGQQAKVFQVLAPFTLEVGNMWWMIRDMIKAKDFAGILLLFIGNYVYNEIAERTKGSRVVFDPINAVVEGTVMLADEDNKLRGSVRFLGRQAGEVISNVPFGQQLAGQIPESTVEQMTSFLYGGGLTKRELFGQGDPGRFGSGLLVIKAFEDPIFRVLTPAGGSQVKITTEGIESYINGGVEDKAGRPNFKIERNTTNLLKAVLFGKNATNESREYFDQREHLFQVLNTQSANRNGLVADAEEKWAELKELGKEKGKAAVKDEIKTIAKGNKVLAEKIIEIVQDELKGLDGVDRLVKQLGIENGERAKFIYETMEDKDSVDEQKAYIKDLAKKKLITEQVLEQIAYLKKGAK